MKNIFFFFCALCFLSFSAYSQKRRSAIESKSIQVPQNISSSFKSNFINVEKNEWKKNYNGNYIASFSNSSHQNQVVEYNTAGNIVKSGIAYPVESLTKNVSTALSIKHASETVKSCTRMEIPGVKPYYRVVVLDNENKEKDLFISEEGTIGE